MKPAKEEMGLVLDDPFHDFSSFELHGLRDGGGEVDVPLFAFPSFDELDLGWKSHGTPPERYLVIQLDTIIQQNRVKIKNKFHPM